MTTFQELAMDDQHDAQRSRDILQIPYDYRKMEISEMPQTFLIEAAYQIGLACLLMKDNAHLLFLKQRLEYELLKRK